MRMVTLAKHAATQGVWQGCVVPLCARPCWRPLRWLPTTDYLCRFIRPVDAQGASRHEPVRPGARDLGAGYQRM